MAAARPDARAGIGLRQPHGAEFLARRPPLGFVEVHSENYFADGGAALAMLLEVREQVAVSLHGVGLALGSAVGLDAWHLDRLARLVERIDPVRISDHAAFARAPRATGGPVVHASDLLPIATTPAALQVMVDNVQSVQDRLRRPLLVENLSAYLQWADGGIAEPEFFNQLARRSGCGLLLDVNNLVVNALNDGVDAVAAACDWIDALDPAFVGEIHLAGCHDSGDLVIDDHGSRVRDSVWQVYRHALRHVGAVPTLIEWDTHLPALDVLLDEARQSDQLMQAAALEGDAASLAAAARPSPGRPGPPGSAPGEGRDREARRQQALLRALWRDDAPGALTPWLRGDAARLQRGLRAYHANAAATAARALSAAYPVMQQLLGTDAFAALAHGLWRQQAPARGDLAQWGAALAVFVAERAELAGEPYLADIARLEWALHLALHSADARHGHDGPIGPPGLERLGTHDPARLRLRLRPGTAVVVSDHPIVSIWQAHQNEPGNEGTGVSEGDRFATARSALAARQAESALVFRDGWRPAACHVQRAAAAFTQSLLQGLALGPALDHASTDFAFDAWLRQALGQAWLVGVDVDVDIDEGQSLRAPGHSAT